VDTIVSGGHDTIKMGWPDAYPNPAGGGGESKKKKKKAKSATVGQRRLIPASSLPSSSALNAAIDKANAELRALNRVSSRRSGVGARQQEGVAITSKSGNVVPDMVVKKTSASR
jgi:hypothetical protein